MGLSAGTALILVEACYLYIKPSRPLLSVDFFYNVPMPETLLRTKLYKPLSKPSLVPRPYLVEKLTQGLAGKLTLVSAPAGFGKTTLLSSWVHQVEMPAAWVSLDLDDNDPSRFWIYVFAALEGVAARLGTRARAALEAPQPPPIEALLTNLINQAIALPEKVILVLDDYHVIENQIIDQAISFWLERLPPQIHLVLCGRSDPMLNLARLRGQGQMTEIRERDLRFSVAEVRAFFQGVAGATLSADMISALHSRTEGWAVGLQLAAMVIQGRDDAAEFIYAFAGDNSFVADYLTEEVLNQQPEPVRRFLLRTSILNRLNGPLCDAVVGEVVNDLGNSQQMLAYLDKHNLFLVSLDDRRYWFRYHQLFAELLRYRLEQTQPTWVRSVHNRAGSWYAANGYVDEALNHWITAEDWDFAADLIESVAPDLIGQGRITILDRYLGSLPESFIQSRPYLCLYHAWILNVTNQAEYLESRIQDVERALSAQKPDAYATADIRGQIAAIRAYDARRRKELALAIKFSDEALALLPDDNLRARSAALFHLGLTQLHQGNLEEAAKALAQGRQLGEPGGNLYVTLATSAYLTDVLVAQGKLGQAAELCVQTIERSLDRHQKESLAGLAYVYASLGQILYERNELEEAAVNLTEGVELGELTGNWRATMAALMALAWLRQMEGNTNEAGRLLLEASDLSDQARTSFREMELAAWQARFDLVNGNLAAARHWMESYGSEDAAQSGSHNVSDRVLVRVLLAHKQASEALDVLDQLGRKAESEGAAGRLVEIRALKALAYLTQNEPRRAFFELERALTLAEPEGYARTFIDEGAPMAVLLGRFVSQLDHGSALGGFARRLLAAMQNVQFGGSDFSTLPDELFISFTKGELIVLRLLAAGYKTPEMADELQLAKSTIKWYLRNIYGKLGVHRRADAIAMARELNLL